MKRTILSLMLALMASAMLGQTDDEDDGNLVDMQYSNTDRDVVIEYNEKAETK